MAQPGYLSALVLLVECIGAR